MPDQSEALKNTFVLEEATIDELHQAIRDGRTTCVAVVRHYIERARAYNGVASALVTEDGAAIPQAPGTVRAQAPLRFPTATVKASTLFPDLDKYQGPPLEFGRMEPTASDPDVQQQFGMIVGMPNAGQVNALATLNIRGERSVTCKGDYDRHPSEGALPVGAPPVCDEFRRQPDALERAAELDAQFGRNPDLEKMPMYGVVFSFKDPFDAKDMRSTGGADARYDIDFPARDHILIDQLRKKGAIIYAKAVNTEYNGRPGDYNGRNKPGKVLPSVLGYQRSTWGGNPSNVYDTTRAASLGSSSGSAVSVSANLVMCSLGEETRASCRGPSNHNSVALILPHKAMLGFDGGAVGADIYCDRTGVHARKFVDCAKVLDALKDPVNGYYDPRDPYTTVPRSSVLSSGYTVHAKMAGTAGALKGMRIGIVRESMLNPGVKAAEPITTAAAKEIKTMLGEKLGATLVESSDPLWTRDTDVEAMTVDFRRALARLVPVFMPDLLFRLDSDGQPLFKEFAAAIQRTEFEPGKFFGTGTMQPIDYCVALADGLIEPPANLDISTVQHQELAPTFRYHISQYLSRRAADWKARGYTETLADWAALNARSKFWGDDQRAAWKNWEETSDPRNRLGQRQGVNERIMLRELLRRVDMMVILENRLDALVRLHTPLPPAKIGGPEVPGPIGALRNESQYGPNAGLSEVLIPAGYVRTAYDPVFALSADGKKYIGAASDKPTAIPEPGLPFSLVFRAEPGKEDILLKIASAYEAASKRRVPPPAFGPLPMQSARE
ncbi:MAG: amidase, Asp-tRNAAsn/Glu-tRNAGln amidotransferase subunit [Betaproteobacteria bacterium]|nr:amidase, Asp-tRNAAsn/Glu-tRNAGln amidotransferase subunit [Betaproteobacteria bacterium]